MKTSLDLPNHVTSPNPSKGGGQDNSDHTGAPQLKETAPSPSEGGASYTSPLERSGEVRKPNQNTEIVNQLDEKNGLRFANEKETSPNPSKGGGQDNSGHTGAPERKETDPSPSEGGASYTSPLERSGEVRTPNLNTEIVNQLDEKQDNSGHTEAGYITANPYTYPYIKDVRDELKKNPTEAEKVIWEYLRAKKTGYKIRRQHVIDNFIVDFVCLSKKVVIEIDGKIHLQQKEQDELRTYALNEEGYKVIRFTNEEVISNPQSVAKQIKEILDSR